MWKKKETPNRNLGLENACQPVRSSVPVSISRLTGRPYQVQTTRGASKAFVSSSGGLCQKVDSDDSYYS